MSDVCKANREISRYLEEIGYSNYAILEEKRGHQGVCYLFGDKTGGRSVAVKVFYKSQQRYQSYNRIKDEFEGLMTLKSALKNLSGVDCPTPVSILPLDGGHGYVMSAIPGVSLSAWTKGKHKSIKTRLLTSLVQALAEYYKVSFRPYGDFHPDNILVSSEGSLYLLDPTAPSAAHRRVECALLSETNGLADETRLLAIDVGYWLYSTTARSFRKFIISPAETLRIYSLTRSLISIAEGVANESDLFFYSASIHCDRLMQSDKTKQRLVGYFTKLAVTIQKLSKLDVSASSS